MTKLAKFLLLILPCTVLWHGTAFSMDEKNTDNFVTIMQIKSGSYLAVRANYSEGKIKPNKGLGKVTSNINEAFNDALKEVVKSGCSLFYEDVTKMAEEIIACLKGQGRYEAIRNDINQND